MMRHRAVTLIFVLITVLLIATDCNSIAAHRNRKQKPAPNKNAINDSNYRVRIPQILGKGETVFLYFHARRIRDSLNEVKIFKKELKASKGKNRLIMIDAEKNPAMHNAFAVEYAPTIVVIRPKVGVVYTFVVDVDDKEVRALANGQPEKLNENQKRVSDNITAKRPTVLFFMAQWCGYCQAMLPDVKKFKEKFTPQVGLIEIDVDRDYATADNFMVNGTPDIVVLDKFGLPFSRMPGPRSYEDIEKAVKKLGVLASPDKEPSKS